MVRRRRANAEGSIYWNEARGRWEALLVVGRNANGAPKRRKFTGRTRADVTAKLDAAKQARAHGLDVPDPSTTVETFTTWWLAERLPDEGLAPATEQWYAAMLERYVLPHVGHKTLTGPRALTVGDVEAMVGKLARRGHSARTQQGARVALGKVLRSAERQGLIGRNVARLAPAPRDRGKARTPKALTAGEVATLLDKLDGTPWHSMVVVGVTTGLRPGELLALHWADVQLGKEPHLSVRYSISWVSGRPPELKAPKRERSHRAVPLAPEAVAALKVEKRRQAEARLAAGDLWDADWPGLVFTTTGGKPHRLDTYGHALRAAVPGVHPHRLRHTYASHLVEAGVPIAHVAELLGDTVAVVESTYAHVLRPKHEVVDVVRGVLGG